MKIQTNKKWPLVKCTVSISLLFTFSAFSRLGSVHLKKKENGISSSNVISRILLIIFRDTHDADGESKAASSLGEVYLQMGEFDKASEYHQMDYDISESHEVMEGKVNGSFVKRYDAETNAIIG